MEIHPIAHIHNDFRSKFGIPRQSGLVPTLSQIIFEPEYRNDEALRGLEDFSHIWLIWGFSENDNSTWHPSVRPPRLGGNVHMGVFATRSPFRPNGLGLSSVELKRIEKHDSYGSILLVSGADLMDGTPIYDIKPYIASDIHPEAAVGFTSQNTDYHLSIELPNDLAQKLPEDTLQSVKAILSQDPRPQYQNDESRIYGFTFANYEILFRVQNKTAIVCDIQEK